MPSIISPNIRVRHPKHFFVGDGSIIDDFCYFSTKVRIGRYSHIASGCSVAGGIERTFVLGDYSSLSAGVRIWCTSDDFVNDLITIIPPECGPIKDHLMTGDVICESLTAVGANSVVMPRNHLPEGTAIGALSLVPPNFPFKAWSVYAGIPIRFMKPRNRDNVLRQRDEMEQRLKDLTHA
ncbi:MAG: acyltransferase [Candidatus Omnitrophica bacterium]|nr:acyltransferase [Candidatus Omnitrophota bacterium]